MHKVLLASVMLGALFALPGPAANAMPAAAIQQMHQPAAVTQVDYYYNHHHWHHRRWYHHHWHYWD